MSVEEKLITPNMRRIKSYVLREGRLTVGQERALNELWPLWGIEYKEEQIDFCKIFGRDESPTTIEIGFGMGKSLVEMAKNETNRNFIGIEVHTPGIGSCLSDIRNENLSNLRIIHHDAIEVFQNMIPDDSINTIQLFFPDPWHKARHHKRRIVKESFLDLIIPKLKTGGKIHMATDWENYAEQMLEVLSTDQRLKNTSENNTYVPRPETRPLTKFELRGQRLGHGVWDLIFEKV
ncbi:MAG: tRNA (guanosine(46)-N7)-methyltransferase TrmB [Succinivibrionaceae bacterium]